MASRSAPRALPLRALRQIGSGPAAGRAGGEGELLPGEGGSGSAASCRGGGRAGAEGPRADRPPPWLGERLPPPAEPGLPFILVWWMRRGA